MAPRMVPLNLSVDFPDLPISAFLAAVDPWAFEEDSGEFQVGGVPFWLVASSDEEDEEEDSDYGSISEEEEEEQEGEEDDQRLLPPEEFWAGWRASPAQAAVDLPQIPVPQQRAESPSPAFRALQRMFEDSLHHQDLGQLSPAAPPAPPSPPAPAPTSPSAPSPPIPAVSAVPAPDFRSLGGSKRSRDGDEEESDAKRPRFSHIEDGPDDPSTSAGTSGGFAAFARAFKHHLLHHPESDED